MGRVFGVGLAAVGSMKAGRWEHLQTPGQPGIVQTRTQGWREEQLCWSQLKSSRAKAAKEADGVVLRLCLLKPVGACANTYTWRLDAC